MGTDKNGKPTQPVFKKITNNKEAEALNIKYNYNDCFQSEGKMAMENNMPTVGPGNVVPTNLTQPVPNPQNPVAVSTEDLRAKAREMVSEKYVVDRQPIDTLEKALALSNIKGIKWGVIGLGQGGSRLAEQFYKFGYPACVANTAKQDLTFINIPEENKLFMDYALGGAGKDMHIGEVAVKEYSQAVLDLMEKTFKNDVETIIICACGGGGCIEEQATVYTSLYGLDSIVNVYNNVKQLNLQEIQHDEKSSFIDVRSLNLMTQSLNDKGEFEQDQIQEVWKWNVPAEQVYTIKIKNGTEITTSNHHPFAVFESDKITYKRADQLRPGSLVFQPSITKWSFDENPIVDGVKITPDVSWLIGGILAAINVEELGKERILIPICCDTAVTDKAIKELKRAFGIPSAVMRNKGRAHIELKPNAKMLNICGITKTADNKYTLRVPQWIVNNNIKSVHAFLSGVMDFSGSASTFRMDFYSNNPQVVKEVCCLLHLIGIKAHYYNSKLARVTTDRFALFGMLKEYVKREKSRICGLYYKSIPNKTTGSGLYDKVSQYLVSVVSVENSKKQCDFYDFTVAKNNNYPAGKNGLSVVHNTGSGGVSELVQLIKKFELPIVVLYTLPMASEGALTKANSIKALDKIAKLAQQDIVNALIVADNSKIEQIYPSISAGQFWKIANFDIVNILNTYNTLCRCDTDFETLDPMDFARIFSTGNCTIFGKIEVPIHIENDKVIMTEGDISTAILRQLHNGLLADGFDLKETIAGGMIVTGREDILNQISAVSINFAYAELNKALGDANLYRGLYKDNNPKNCLTVYTIFSGLGLPRARVETLLREAQTAMQNVEQKVTNKNKMNISLDNSVSSAEQQGYDNIKQDSTAFGRLASKRGSRRQGDGFRRG